MLIHFASGKHPFSKPWINIDPYAQTADLDIDLLEEFPEIINGVEWAYVGHFLEHLTVDEGITFLRRVHERMSPQGKIMVVGPDADKGQTMFDHGRLSSTLLCAIKMHGPARGNDRRDCHLWDCTGSAVVDQLKQAGWNRVTEFPINRLPVDYPEVPVINLSSWQFAVYAVSS